MKNSSIIDNGIKIFASNIGRFFHKVTILEGEENLIIDSPTIIVLNHQSMTETTAIIRLLYKHIHRFPRYLAMEEAFSWPVIGYVAKKLNFIPVSRGTSNAKESLQHAINYLNSPIINNDYPIVVIYPEGGLSKNRNDVSLRKFYTGVGRIVEAVPNIKVIPIAQYGSYPGAKNIIKSFLTHPNINVMIGSPLYFSINDENSNAKSITEKIKSAIIVLYDQLKDS